MPDSNRFENLYFRCSLIVWYRSKQAGPRLATWVCNDSHWSNLESASNNGVVVPMKCWRPEQRLVSKSGGAVYIEEQRIVIRCTSR